MRSKTLEILAILEDHFGDIVAEVGGALMAYENPTLHQIYRSLSTHRYNVAGRVDSETTSKVTMANIIKSLLILYQHNCLYYCVPDLVAESKIDDHFSEKLFLNEATLKAKGYRYSLNEKMVLNRLRFSKYISRVYKTLGLLPSLVFEEIIHHGRLQAHHIMQSIRQKIALFKESNRLLPHGQPNNINAYKSLSFLYTENDISIFQTLVT